MFRKQKGFTLAELLIVITIVVILGLIALIGINPLAQIFKGYDAVRRADIQKIKIALEGYYADHECYPSFPLGEDGKPTYTCNSEELKPYLSTMPCDPNSNLPYPLYLLPGDSTCPQQFAVYANILSVFDLAKDEIANCPNTIVETSPEMRNYDIISGCASVVPCATHYGCKYGACIVVSEDGENSPCSPASCESDCGAGLNDDGTPYFYTGPDGVSYSYCGRPEFNDTTPIPASFHNQCESI